MIAVETYHKCSRLLFVCLLSVTVYVKWLHVFGYLQALHYLLTRVFRLLNNSKLMYYAYI